MATYSEKPGGSHATHMECLRSPRSVCFPGCCAHTHSTCCQTSRVLSLSCVRLFAAPGTVAREAPLSMGFSRQGCWSGLPCPSPGDLPHPGNEPRLLHWQADSLPLSHILHLIVCLCICSGNASDSFFCGLVSILIGSARAPQIWKSVSK